MEQLGYFGEEEEEFATKRRKEHTDLWLALSERDEQITCHALVLVLPMADEACWEAEM